MCSECNDVPRRLLKLVEIAQTSSHLLQLESLNARQLLDHARDLQSDKNMLLKKVRQILYSESVSTSLWSLYSARTQARVMIYIGWLQGHLRGHV